MLFIYKLTKFLVTLGLFLCSLGLLISLMEGETTGAYIFGAAALLLLWAYSYYSKLITNKTKENTEKAEREQKQKAAEAYKKYVSKFGLEYSPVSFMCLIECLVGNLWASNLLDSVTS